MTAKTMGFLSMAAMFGFVGGWSATHLTTSQPAAAQVGERFPITTTGVTIVTETGQPRATLGLWDGKHPALIFSDDGCDRRASLIVAPQERAALTIFGKDCKRRIALELQGDDLPSFVLRDRNDVPRARLHLLNDGTPVMTFYGPNGELLQSMP